MALYEVGYLDGTDKTKIDGDDVDIRFVDGVCEIYEDLGDLMLAVPISNLRYIVKK